jgi:hypothetical protein
MGNTQTVRKHPEEVAKEINPVVRGWINYYGKFYTSKLKTFMREVNLRTIKWARSKYLKIRPSLKKGLIWLKQVSIRKPDLFAHWKLLGAVPAVKIIGAVKVFGYVKDWLTRKIRRHLMRAKGKQGFGWTRWSTKGVYAICNIYSNFIVAPRKFAPT